MQFIIAILFFFAIGVGINAGSAVGGTLGLFVGIATTLVGLWVVYRIHIGYASARARRAYRLELARTGDSEAANDAFFAEARRQLPMD